MVIDKTNHIKHIETNNKEYEESIVLKICKNKHIFMVLSI